MRKLILILRASAVVLLTLGVLAAGLQGGADGPAPAQAAPPGRYWAPGEMPEFAGALEYPLGDGMAVNGVEMRISYYEARAEPEQLRDFYVEKFMEAGYLPQVTEGVSRGWSVSAPAADGRAQALVAILRTGPNRSLVLPSIVPLNPVPTARQLGREELPTSESAVGIMQTSSRDRPGDFVVTWQEPLQSAREAAGAIRDRMVASGWTLAEFAQPPLKHQGHLLELTQAGRKASLTVAAWPGSQVGAAVTAHFSASE